MPLAIFGFLHLSFSDILDIFLVGILIFAALKWLWESTAKYILIGVILVLVCKFFADIFNMKLMASVLGAFIDIGVVAIIVIFQPEIRRALMTFGKNSTIKAKASQFMAKLFGTKAETMDSASVTEITEACRSMSGSKTGALIVFPHEKDLSYIIETGDKIDGIINRRLIMNLFFKNSPLHDGAMIIHEDRIVAARCTLPITDRADIPARYGMRHKAAIGMTEESDADVIVVSEETGGISFVHDGNITTIGNINELRLLLNKSFSEKWRKDNEETPEKQGKEE